MNAHKTLTFVCDSIIQRESHRSGLSKLRPTTPTPPFLFYNAVPNGVTPFLKTVFGNSLVPQMVNDPKSLPVVAEGVVAERIAAATQHLLRVLGFCAAALRLNVRLTSVPAATSTTEVRTCFDRMRLVAFLA